MMQPILMLRALLIRIQEVLTLLTRLMLTVKTEQSFTIYKKPCQDAYLLIPLKMYLCRYV